MDARRRHIPTARGDGVAGTPYQVQLRRTYPRQFREGQYALVNVELAPIIRRDAVLLDAADEVFAFPPGRRRAKRFGSRAVHARQLRTKLPRRLRRGHDLIYALGNDF